MASRSSEQEVTVNRPSAAQAEPGTRTTLTWRRGLAYGLIGVVAGFFSGLFGVGGGVVIVPLLILFAHFDQRRASGTSLTAILPVAIAGVLGYANQGEVDWHAALYLASGALLGSFIGAWLLHRTPLGALRWIFIGFLVLMAASMFLVVPDRDAILEVTPGVALVLLGVGLLVGTLSGLLGVGGGVLVVPILVVALGMGDLAAKGTSLLMIVPTAIGGTIANARRKNSDLRSAIVIGLIAIPASFAGVAVSAAIPAHVGTALFAVLLAWTAVQLAIRAMRARSKA